MTDHRRAEADVLSATHSHLFPGARLRGRVTGDATAPTPLRVVFADGVEVAAALEETVADGRLVLAMPSFVTAAGTEVAAAVWFIRDVEPHAGAGDVSLRLGPRLAPPRAGS